MGIRLINSFAILPSTGDLLSAAVGFLPEGERRAAELEELRWAAGDLSVDGEFTWLLLRVECHLFVNICVNMDNC